MQNLLQFLNPAINTAQLDELLDVASMQTASTIKEALSMNQETVNQILLRLLISFKFNSGNHKYLIKSEPDSRRLAQRLVGTAFPIDVNGYRISYYESISKDSWFNVLSFLTMTDFYGSTKNTKNPKKTKNTKGTQNRTERTSLHCVSKFFNRTITDFFAQVDKAEPQSSQGFYTARELSTNIQFDSSNTLHCQFQCPNGLKTPVKVEKFPEISTNGKPVPNTDLTVQFRMTDSNVKHNGLKISMPFDTKILFDAPYYRDSDQSQQLKRYQNKLTLFGSIENYNYNRTGSVSHSFRKIESLYGDKTNKCKLIDVNLYNMFNYYIYNFKDFKLFDLFGLDRYSIAEMAYKYSKRQWVIGIIDINSNNGNNKSYTELRYNYDTTGQIQFYVDITDEIKATFTTGNDDDQDVNNHNDTFNKFEKSALAKTRISDWGSASAQWNIVKHGRGRYYLQCYADSSQLFLNSIDTNHDVNNNNNSGVYNRIIGPFGKKTSKEEQVKILETPFESLFKQDLYFMSMKPTVKFNCDKMYKYWFKHISKDPQLDLEKKLAKLIVDYRHNTRWQCAFLLHPKVHNIRPGVDVSQITENGTFYTSIDEMKRLTHETGNGVTILQVHFALAVGTVVYQRKAWTAVHLDDALGNTVAYFGQKTSKNQQKKILEIGCTWFKDSMAKELWQRVKDL